MADEAIGYLMDQGLGAYLDLEGPRHKFGSERDEWMSAVDPDNRISLPPDADDLSRLHKIIRSRKVTTVLVFGVGCSTLVMADAIVKNKRDYGTHVDKHLRRNNAFEIHSVDADDDFISRTKALLPGHLQDVVNITFSGVSTTAVEGRVVTYYDQLPNVSPDFIYLDAPNQFQPVGDVHGISTRHADRMPMSADILLFEHFLTPGTLILVDGRTANARYLRSNLQRKWNYSHDEESDVHTFELREAPLGRYNSAQIEFSLGSDWLNDIE